MFSGAHGAPYGRSVGLTQHVANVATLARDDSVHIAPMAGTTRKARRFPMQVNDELLYELVDTPGIQRTRSVLTWMKEHNANAASHPETIKRFVEEHAEDPHFNDEYYALKHIVEGAGIICVVDGSCPFGAVSGHLSKLVILAHRR